MKRLLGVSALLGVGLGLVVSALLAVLVPVPAHAADQYPEGINGDRYPGGVLFVYITEEYYASCTTTGWTWKLNNQIVATTEKYRVPMDALGSGVSVQVTNTCASGSTEVFGYGAGIREAPPGWTPTPDPEPDPDPDPEPEPEPQPGEDDPLFSRAEPHAYLTACFLAGIATGFFARLTKGRG